jgi:GntR family transcriptional regulator / MocR family aminotransferase
MLPYSNLITIKKDSQIPVYLQITNSFIRLIKEGILARGTKLPGSRALSETINVHRKTIIAALDELQAQGWIYTTPSRGTYISETIPDIVPAGKKPAETTDRTRAGFYLKKNTNLDTLTYKKTNLLELNDGLPDLRLAPMESLARTMRSVLKGERGKISLSYNDIEGSLNLRNELQNYLTETRGFQLSAENIFITRGSVMGIYLSLAAILEKGDNVVAASPGYRAVSMITRQLGASLISVPADEHGLVVEEVEKLCNIKKIRAIYVTPHHHYPTTVTMPPERRLQLLSLAEKHGIAVLEDDYDYDYHFSHSPYLPLASADQAGVVIYIGSFSKTFSPALRVGYITGPADFIQEVAKIRRIIDRQGDSILEHSIAEMFKLGEIKSHLRKSHGIYKNRRDYFCSTLKKEFATTIDFRIPEGGLAVWVRFHNQIPLPHLRAEALARGLFITDGSFFGNNCTRLGFASLNSDETNQAMYILKETVSKFT